MCDCRRTPCTFADSSGGINGGRFYDGVKKGDEKRVASTEKKTRAKDFPFPTCWISEGLGTLLTHRSVTVRIRPSLINRVEIEIPIPLPPQSIQCFVLLSQSEHR